MLVIKVELDTKSIILFWYMHQIQPMLVSSDIGTCGGGEYQLRVRLNSIALVQTLNMHI